jgi:hypothetical protein
MPFGNCPIFVSGVSQTAYTTHEDGSVPKHLHIKFRCWGIAHKKENNSEHCQSLGDDYLTILPGHVKSGLMLQVRGGYHLAVWLFRKKYFCWIVILWPYPENM